MKTYKKLFDTLTIMKHGKNYYPDGLMLHADGEAFARSHNTLVSGVLYLSKNLDTLTTRVNMLNAAGFVGCLIGLIFLHEIDALNKELRETKADTIYQTSDIYARITKLEEKIKEKEDF